LVRRIPFAKSLSSTIARQTNSRAVIASYGDRIRIVLKEQNEVQAGALNAAWRFARFPIPIFLDSVDVLLPHAASTIASRWSDQTVKVQAPLVTIDKAGRPLGNVAPKYPPDLDAATLRAELLAHRTLSQLFCQPKRIFTITAGGRSA